jgi:hypothetical protein
MKIVIDLTNFMPPTIRFFSTIIFLLVFTAVVLVYSGGCRFLLGKNTAFNHAISSAIGIMMVYALLATVASMFPDKVIGRELLLPFATFEKENMKLLIYHGEWSTVPNICIHVLWMFLLAYMVNVFDDRLPSGTTLLGWFLFRTIGIVLGTLSYGAARWVILKVYNSYMDGWIPDTLLEYIPVILVGSLAIMILMGLMKLFLIATLFRVNMLFGGLYSFFFDHKDGKPITRAVFTTQILLVVLWVFEKLGYVYIPLRNSSLDGLIPFTLWMAFTWFIVGKFLD